MTVSRVGAQAGGRQVKQDGKFHFLDPRFNGIAESDVNEDAHARACDDRDRFDPYAAIFRYPPNLIDAQKGSIEFDSVFDFNGTYLTERGQHYFHIGIAESQEVDITRCPIRIGDPGRDQHGALQYETVAMDRKTEAIEKAFEDKTREQ